jgi:hypothetical protein
MNEAYDLLLDGATLLTGAGPVHRGWLAVRGRYMAEHGWPTLVDADGVMRDVQKTLEKLWRKAA